MIELGTLKFLLDDLIVDRFEVVGKVQMPDNVWIRNPTLVPFYDFEKFPFVIAMGRSWDREGFDYYMINIK